MILRYRTQTSSILLLCGLFSILAAEVAINNDKCLQCQFLVETFQSGVRKTARQHFSGGDTAWEEKNLGKYATSETRLVEITEGLCKKRSLDSTTKYNDISELEFKCAALLEENEEIVEEYYFNKQNVDMSAWLCIQQLKLCCPDGHYGKDCSKCPGLEIGALACFSHGKCHGDGSRKGTGKCDCDAGYVGQMCRHCDGDYFETFKSNTSVLCAKCFEGCAGGCKSAGPTGCNRCKTGWEQKEEEGCVDIDECSTTSACQKDHEVCVNLPGSFRCDCEENYKREGENCELDIEAGPRSVWIRPDLLLRFISMTSLAAIIVLVVWKRSLLLICLTGIAVVLILIIEVNVNPDSVPDEARSFLPH